MLTLNDIINAGFRKSGFSGYRMDDVDAFIDRVKESYEALLKKTSDTEASLEKLRADGLQNAEKVRDLSQKLEVFRSQEDEIKDALISAKKASETSKNEAQHAAEAILKEAQQKADSAVKQASQQEESILNEASEKAQAIVQDAKAKAKNLVSDTSRQIIEQKQEQEQLVNAAAEFREKLLSLYKEHLTLINQLPHKKSLSRSELTDSTEENAADDAPKALETAAHSNDVPPSSQEEKVRSAIQPDLGEPVRSAIQPDMDEKVPFDGDLNQPEKAAPAEQQPEAAADIPFSVQPNADDESTENSTEESPSVPAKPVVDDDGIVPEPESAIYNSIPQEPRPTPPQTLDDSDDGRQPTISNFDN